jgi:2-keto-4-pentenoate hydratase/2-oxohepta-3-ene-1,7-dioic acid hydratase in catechol pathway
MKLLNFSTPDNPTVRLGIATEKGVVDVTREFPVAPATTLDVIANGIGVLPEIARAAKEFLSEDEITFAPCVVNPEKIICIGLNYRKHAEESGAEIPAFPILFSKYNNALAAHREDIPLADNAVQYDYEAELVIVVGKKARYVSEEDALDYVFGYCVANDLSTRELQVRTNQWLLGKTMDKGMPLGPYLVTNDEIADPHNLKIMTHVNGELRQDEYTSDLLFKIPQLISYISQYFTLQPGDIISTGTPSGVALGMETPDWLKPGDQVSIEIEGLGTCVNRFVAE